MDAKSTEKDVRADKKVVQIEQPAAAGAAESEKPPQCLGEGKPKRKTVRKRKNGKSGKIHIRLPSIEAYQKDIVFTAEAPGRVVVRLERLMGSDKIRPVDGKYMETLLQRLEEEETRAWKQRIRLRKKAETERYRRLAINGLMEPGPGMEEIYNHPVYRVNKILTRLDKMDHLFSGNPAIKLPPIVPVDPFENDDSGKSFMEYPAHRQMSKYFVADNLDTEEEEEEKDGEADVPLTKTYADFVAEAAAKASAASRTAAEQEEEEEEIDEDEFDEELESTMPTTTEEPGEPEELELESVELSEMEELTRQVDLEYKASLSTLMKKYGVPQSDRFEDTWKPFRSALVEGVFNDFENFDEMYEVANAVLEAYLREQFTADDYMAPYYKDIEDSKSLMLDAEEEDEEEEAEEEGDREDGGEAEEEDAEQEDTFEGDSEEVDEELGEMPDAALMQDE